MSNIINIHDRDTQLEIELLAAEKAYDEAFENYEKARIRFETVLKAIIGNDE